MTKARPNTRKPPKGYDIHVVYLGYGPIHDGSGDINPDGCAGDGEMFMTRAEAVQACWNEKLEVDRAREAGELSEDALETLADLERGETP